MSIYYDEIELDDLTFDPGQLLYTYPCPCGDRFIITEDDLYNGETVARCPSCSLLLKVIYDPNDFDPK